MIISHNHEVWKGRDKKPVEPNLTQRMRNELSPSPTTGNAVIALRACQAYVRAVAP